jgi:hypothetical protein
MFRELKGLLRLNVILLREIISLLREQKERQDRMLDMTNMNAAVTENTALVGQVAPALAAAVGQTSPADQPLVDAAAQQIAANNATLKAAGIAVPGSAAPVTPAPVTPAQ